MAKVIITIEDIPEGKVKVTANPNFETMMKMDMSGATLTSAHGLAFRCLRMMWDEFRTNAPIKRIIPKLS